MRWMPDQLARARAAVVRLLAPAARLLDQVRRPRPERAAVRLTVWRPYLTPEQRGYVEAVIRAKIPLPDCTVQLAADWAPCGGHVDGAHVRHRAGPAMSSCWPHGLPCGDRPVLWRVGGWAGGRSACMTTHRTSRCLLDQVPARACWLSCWRCRCWPAAGQVLILDRKGSHRWAVGLPRVAYARRPAQMHDLLIRAAALADQRNQRTLEEPEGWDPGPRVLVICEELNATLGQLRTTGLTCGRPASLAPARPSGHCERLLSWAGSAKDQRYRCRADAHRPGHRRSRGPRKFRNPVPGPLHQQRMAHARAACADATPHPPGRTVADRVRRRRHGDASRVAVRREARAFAARGGGGHGVLGGAVPAQRSRSDRPSTRDVPGDAPPAGDSGDSEPEPIDPLSEPLTLRDAVAQGVLPWSCDAAKKRLQRSPTRPEPVGKRGQAALYRRGDLIAWAEQEMSRMHPPGRPPAAGPAGG